LNKKQILKKLILDNVRILKLKLNSN